MAYNTVDMTKGLGVEAEAVAIKTGLPPPEILWCWLNEFPQNNFDDFGPKNLDELLVEITRRAHRGEWMWTVYVGDRSAGVIGYAPQNEYCGVFHGICITKEWHGTGVAQAAVSKVIDEIFTTSQQKISASFFRDNERVHKFLCNLGFCHEGLLMHQTLRGGKPVDMTLMALFKEDWLCRSAAS